MKSFDNLDVQMKICLGELTENRDGFIWKKTKN